MRTLKFHYAGAWNFLPFGPEGIEIHFDKLGKIIHIKGENRDVKPLDNNVSFIDTDENKISSNGSGKSTLQEILCWGIYGKTIKGPTKIKVDDVIHNLISKKCRVIIVVDKYRIERGRKPSFLRLWESEKHEWNDATELTLGGMPATQKKIEEIIGLSYEAFVNICVFTDNQSSCFLECDGPTKRMIVENLLSLTIYNQRHKTASLESSLLKNSIKTLGREYEILLESKKAAGIRIEYTTQNEKDWKTNKLAELRKLVEQYKEKMQALKTTDTGAAIIAYQEAQEQIKKITSKIESLETKQETRQRILTENRLKESAAKEEARIIMEKAQECQRVIKNQQAKIKEKEKFIADLKSNEPGTKCDKCWGVVDEANYDHVCNDTTKEISGFKTIFNQEMVKAKNLTEQITLIKAKQDKIKSVISDGETQIVTDDVELKKLRTALVTASKVREPKAESAELLIQQQIEELKERAKAKKTEVDGSSPFVDILAKDKIELSSITATCVKKESEVKEVEKLIPYYDYWEKAYGDKGIRKWVVDGIIPALNSRITYWLQFLIDNKITITFNNQLEETIERNPPDGDPYIYHAMSAGQRRRINLAVSQAFAHIMMLATGTIPSLVFLDEVTTNIDPLGVQGIFNMIGELAEEKQVFVTTHDQDLLQMLQNMDVISLCHENGITKMV